MEERIRALLAIALKMDVQAIGDDASSETLANWDSLAHMNIILALEGEFGIRFSDRQVFEILSYRGICEAVRLLLRE